MTKTKCTIWGTPAFEHPSFGDAHFMDSPRAGGKILVSGTAVAVLESCDDLVKALFTPPLTLKLPVSGEGHKPYRYAKAIGKVIQRFRGGVARGLVTISAVGGRR